MLLACIYGLAHNASGCSQQTASRAVAICSRSPARVFGAAEHLTQKNPKGAIPGAVCSKIMHSNDYLYTYLFTYIIINLALS